MREQRDQFQPPSDLVFLDHDLGGRQLEAHEDCGLTFVNLVVVPLVNRGAWVVVHSYNPGGAMRMLRSLYDAGIQALYQPFHSARLADIISSRLRTS